MSRDEFAHRELYQSIVETLEILSDEELAATLRERAEEIRSGPFHTSDEVRMRLGLLEPPAA